MFRALFITLALIGFRSLEAKAMPLQSAAHFGMAMEDNSSTGFKRSVGSAIFFDATSALNDHFDIGLRSLGTDGLNDDSRFYRLGVGPLVSWTLAERWHFQLAPFFFQESGAQLEGEQSYRSKGYGVMVGWERNFALTDKLSLCWGGYMTRHWGQLWERNESVADSSEVASASWIGTTRNDGGSRGVELALKMRL